MELMAKKIQRSRALKMLNAGKAIIYDVRSPVKYRDGTVEGAINLAVRNVSSLSKHPRTTNLVFYGSDEEINDLSIIIKYAMQMGFMNLYTIVE